MSFSRPGLGHSPICTDQCACDTNSTRINYLAGKLHYPKVAPMLPFPSTYAALTSRYDAAKSGLVEGRKVCSLGDPVTTRHGRQHRNCKFSAIPASFQARTSIIE